MIPAQFHEKPSLLAVIAIVLAALFALVVLPSMIITALWNALLFESLHLMGEIALSQGVLLWLMLLASAFLVFDIDLKALLSPDKDAPSPFDDGEDAFRSDAPLDESEYSEHWKKWRKEHPPKDASKKVK